MITRIILATVFILISMSYSIAQENANEVLKNIQEKFNSINDLTAELTQSVNGKVILKAKFTLKRKTTSDLNLKTSDYF